MALPARGGVSYRETSFAYGSSSRPAPAPPTSSVERRHRRRRRRLLIGTTALLLVANLAVGSAYTYFQWRLDQIERVHVPGLLPDEPGQVMNVLLVGSDGRHGLSDEAADQAGQGEVSGERSDTIILLHVDPREQRAGILSIPRDLYVPIAGADGSDRVNAAFALGGPEGLLTTVQESLGIQINHFAEIDFTGFREVVDALGGVSVFVPNPARDPYSGLDLPEAGCVELDGQEALAWVRSRHYEYLTGGRWVQDPRGDLGRIGRQQDFLRRVMKRATRIGLRNPLKLNRLIGIGVRNLTVDAAMSTKDIASVARRFRAVDPDTVDTLVLPTEPRTVDGKDVLVLKQPEARAAVDRLNGGPGAVDTPTTAPPATSSQAPPPAAAEPTPEPADALSRQAC
ncbi:MAG TPA: LCP family protein [Acidimicrobiales bacterium]|nr:LCP family protein [Acidimicrobiales bacterium]